MEVDFEKCKDDAKIFKAFCDDNRLSILGLLREGERCACVLLEKLRISQPTLSHHIKILCEAGIVAARKEGKWTHYSISESGIETARNLLEKIKPEYVCYCAKVTKNAIRNAIVEGGAATVEEVIKQTGAMKNSDCAKNNPKGT